MQPMHIDSSGGVPTTGGIPPGDAAVNAHGSAPANAHGNAPINAHGNAPINVHGGAHGEPAVGAQRHGSPASMSTTSDHISLEHLLTIQHEKQLQALSQGFAAIERSSSQNTSQIISAIENNTRIFSRMEIALNSFLERQSA